MTAVLLAAMALWCWSTCAQVMGGGPDAMSATATVTERKMTAGDLTDKLDELLEEHRALSLEDRADKLHEHTRKIPERLWRSWVARVLAAMERQRCGLLGARRCTAYGCCKPVTPTQLEVAGLDVQVWQCAYHQTRSLPALRDESERIEIERYLSNLKKGTGA